MLSEYLNLQTILCPTTGITKADVIGELTGLLAAQYHLKNPDKLQKLILAREKVGSTFLPIGIAMPHARIPDLDGIKMVMGVLPQGLIENIDENKYPIYVVLLFLTPSTDEFFGAHLQLLARISALFHDATLVQHIAQAESAAQVLQLLQQAEAALVPIQAASSS